jgi:hypothetical protein
MEGHLSDAMFAYKMQFVNNQCGVLLQRRILHAKCSSKLEYQQPMAEVIESSPDSG